jgi:hypothetical protein
VSGREPRINHPSGAAEAQLGIGDSPVPGVNLIPSEEMRLALPQSAAPKQRNDAPLFGLVGAAGFGLLNNSFK